MDFFLVDAFVNINVQISEDSSRLNYQFSCRSKFLKFFEHLVYKTKGYLGNPAGVIICGSEWPNEMQKIAAEINQNETAFIKGAINNQNFELKWFTPTCEVPLCGHATLAAASVIFKEYQSQFNEISFETLSGQLIVTKTEHGYSMDFPAEIPASLTSEQHDLASNLWDIIKKSFENPPHYIEAVLGIRTKKLIFRVRNSDHNRTEIEKMTIPNEKRLLSFHDGSVVRGICIALGDDNTCFSRYFAPWNGLPEDSVTGSLHTVLTPYFTKNVQNKLLEATQRSPRGGSLVCQLAGDRVILNGKSQITIRGKYID